MGDLSNFQRGQIVGVLLAVVSVTTTATLLGVSRASVSEVMMAYTNHGKTQSATRNSGNKPKLRQRDHCMLKGTVSKNYRITAPRLQQNSVFILKTMFPQKKSPVRASQIHYLQ